MALKWVSKDAEKGLTDEILRNFTLSSSGQVQLASLFSEDLVLTQVADAIDFPDAVPEARVSRCVRQGVLAWMRDPGRQPGGLLPQIQAEVDKYLKQPVRRLVLVTTLSFKPDHRIRPQKWGAHELRFYSRCPTRFREARNAIAAKVSIHGRHPTDYAFCVVTTQGRCEFAAADAALTAVDEMRGLWNLLLSLGSRRRSLGKTRPANDIVVGPLHTLHLPSGERAVENLWWWEPTHLEPTRPVLLSEKYSALARRASRIKKRLWNTPMGEPLRTVLRRCARVLDTWDQEAAFLKAWAILEYLTDTKFGHHRVTVSRATSLLKDRERHQQILDYLRGRRNVAVHQVGTGSESEMFLYSLKSYLEVLWLALLDRVTTIRSLEEFGAFLDLPADRNLLVARKRILNLALRARR